MPLCQPALRFVCSSMYAPFMPAKSGLLCVNRSQGRFFSLCDWDLVRHSQWPSTFHTSSLCGQQTRQREPLKALFTCFKQEPWFPFLFIMVRLDVKAGFLELFFKLLWDAWILTLWVMTEVILQGYGMWDMGEWRVVFWVGFQFLVLFCCFFF